MITLVGFPSAFRWYYFAWMLRKGQSIFTSVFFCFSLFLWLNVLRARTHANAIEIESKQDIVECAVEWLELEFLNSMHNDF